MSKFSSIFQQNLLNFLQNPANHWRIPDTNLEKKIQINPKSWKGIRIPDPESDSVSTLVQFECSRHWNSIRYNFNACNSKFLVNLLQRSTLPSPFWGPNDRLPIPNRSAPSVLKSRGAAVAVVQMQRRAKAQRKRRLLLGLLNRSCSESEREERLPHPDGILWMRGREDRRSASRFGQKWLSARARSLDEWRRDGRRVDFCAFMQSASLAPSTLSNRVLKAWNKLLR